MKLLNLNIPSTITSGNAKVELVNDVLTFSLDGRMFIPDTVEYITTFSPAILSTPFSSILIGGLGMGLIPYYIENNFTGVSIDVLENNSGVVEVANQMGHLSKNVNIIYADAITYTTEKKYDFILMDLWWYDDQQMLEDRRAIITNYVNNLNEGGKLYFPVLKELI